MFKTFLAALVCVGLAGCVSTTALEPQNRAMSANQARIYLIFPNSPIARLSRYNIEINDKPVGKLGVGSYFSVDRPTGNYKLSIIPPLGLVRSDHEFHALAGRAYYFVVNVKSATTPLVVNGVYLGTIHQAGTSVGKPVSKQESFAAISIGATDEATGKAMMAQLPKPE